jgi:PAS domain S-box-containing protein
MSSSVLKNVIQPRNAPASISRSGADDMGNPHEPPQDMELILGVLVENAPVSMAMFDKQMRYILANRAWMDEFGLTGIQPLIGRSQYEVFPGLHPGWRQVYERALQGHVIRSEHDALAGPDGARIIYRWEVRPWRRQVDASVGGLMVTCERFGQSKETAAEAESNAADGQSAAAVGQMADCTVPMVMMDAQGVVQSANSAASRLCLAKGLQEGESIFWDVFTEGNQALALKVQVLDLLQSLAESETSEPRILTLQESAGPSTWAAATGAGVTRPSRWLVAKAQSKDESPRFTALALPAEAAPRVPVVPVNLPAIASAVAAISQPLSQESLANSLEMRRLQDDLARAKQELRTLHEAGRTFNQRDSRAKQYLEVLPCGVLVLNELGTPVYQNEPLGKLLGRPIHEHETVEQWLAAACPSDQHRENVAALWREDVWRRQLTRTFSLATADGLLKELEFQPMSLPGGGLLISILDSTEKCRHEEQLRATEAKFRTLLQEAPLPIVMMDKTGAVFEVNHRAEALLGHPKNELRRYPLDAWLEPESGLSRRESVRQMQAEGQRSAQLEVSVRQAEGAPVSASLHLAQVTDADGEPHCTIHFFQQSPVAQAVQWTQDEVIPTVLVPQQEEVVMTPVITVTETLLFKTNVNGRIKECSQRGLELLGLTAEEAESRPLHQHFRPSDATGFYADMAELAETPDQVVETICYHSSGERLTVQFKVSPRGFSGYDFEVTEWAEIQTEVPVSQAASVAQAAPVAQTVATSVVMQSAPEVVSAPEPASPLQGVVPWPMVNLPREKLLLSETHHRIKNHLQIISSLLNLESNSTTDATARNALRSSQNRVRSIADLHQHLYEIAVGTSEGFNQFAEGLVGHLRECYQLTVDRVDVQFDLQAGEIQQEWLMPLALTLNETLSNCFEHAFSDGRHGLVKAALTFKDNQGELIVSDNGVGIPDDLRPGSGTGLGLKILTVFAEQMRGQLALGRSDSGGTEISLRFPIAYADI